MTPCRSREWTSSFMPQHSRRYPSYTTAIFSNVYPNVSASAACVRTRSLMELLLKLQNGGGSNEVYYLTSAVESSQHHRANALPQGAKMFNLPPNNSSRFRQVFGSSFKSDTETLLQERIDPDAVIFDRFFTEEQFSYQFWNQREHLGKAALILDMQDMHSLRWGRQDIVTQIDKAAVSSNGDYSYYDPLEACLPSVMAFRPSATDDRLLRELASIHRSDLTLVCSPHELELLQREYGVPSKKLHLASFFVNKSNVRERKKITNDADWKAIRFVFCGGFRHAPNFDAVMILLRHIWPRLHSELPLATLHIYGAFCPSAAQLQQQMKINNNAMKNVHVHGYVESLDEIFDNTMTRTNSRKSILLAPLRFGAGIKGKIVDAWSFGMPVVTTPVGSEGMTLPLENGTKNAKNMVFGGLVATSLNCFCHAAVKLSTDNDAYRQAQANARYPLRELYAEEENGKRLQDAILSSITSLQDKRQCDYIQSMLWHQSQRSTEYFSRWIESKETRNHKSGASVKGE